MASKSSHLFVWRTEFFDSTSKWESVHAAYSRAQRCRVCGTALGAGTHGSTMQLHRTISFSSYDCPLCGWHLGFLSDSLATPGDVYTDNSYSSYNLSILFRFDINAPQVALEELGTYLRNHISDVYSLSPRRFEELTADVLRLQGFRVALTQATRDGGVDIVVLHHDNDDRYAIVECKKYAKGRRVGIEIVRALVGAAVDWEVKKAYLVTTSDFSSIARNSVSSYRKNGYEIDLVALSDLTSLLDVYNAGLPRLEALTEDMRERIADANRHPGDG